MWSNSCTALPLGFCLRILALRAASSRRPDWTILILTVRVWNHHRLLLHCGLNSTRSWIKSHKKRNIGNGYSSGVFNLFALFASFLQTCLFFILFKWRISSLAGTLGLFLWVGGHKNWLRLHVVCHHALNIRNLWLKSRRKVNTKLSATEQLLNTRCAQPFKSMWSVRFW